MARHASGDPPRHSQQKMSGAAGWINDRHLQQCGGGVLRFRLDAVEHRVEGAVEQSLNQAIRRVIAAGRLARMTFRLAALGEGKAAAVLDQARCQFEQALID